MADDWFVVNAADARWKERPGFGTRCELEPEGSPFPQLGIRISVLGPGDRSTLYHAEDAQEGFLVLRGACTAVVEDEERPVRRWDFVHCPAGTRHVFVNEGDEPCVLLMVGARIAGAGIVYPVSEVALRHGAGVEREARSPGDAYAGLPRWRDTTAVEL